MSPDTRPQATTRWTGSGLLRWVIPALALAIGVATHADEMDDLLGGGDGDAFLGLDEDSEVTQEQFEAKMTDALKETTLDLRRQGLQELLDLRLRARDVVLLPLRENALMDAVLAEVDLDVLARYVPRFLGAASDNLQFDPAARGLVDMGVRLSVVAGGASFDDLSQLLARHRGVLDLEWLLPAVARAGGEKALPLVATYRQDAAIIPVGNSQNIRRVPCAAVLACAYAGDAEALEMVMSWYEEDTVNRPRFAFYVAWAIQEGMKPDRGLLDYCQHRINQAERLLASRGRAAVPGLIERAGRDLSVSLTSYLMRCVAEASPDELPLYSPLLEHPSAIVKQRVFVKLVEAGGAAGRELAMAKARELLSSARGTDRFFGHEMLVHLDPEAHAPALEAAIRRDRNGSVRRRLRDFQP